VRQTTSYLDWLSPEKRGGLNGSVQQHLLAVYPPESEIPKFFLDADLNAARPRRAVIENSRTSWFLYPNEERREGLASQVNLLRDHRAEVAAFLKTRGIIPAMPPGVRLVKWNLKEPPIAIEYHRGCHRPGEVCQSHSRRAARAPDESEAEVRLVRRAVD
jgi:hypothetical protein